LSKKVIVRVFGGLGNQLFCYAAARRLAIVNDAELVIDHVSGFKYDYTYKRTYQLDKFNIPCRLAIPAERLEPFSRIRRAFLKRLEKKRPLKKRRYIVQDGMDFDRRILDLRVKKNVYLEGYWQSEKYFKDIEETIREDFKINHIQGDKNFKVSGLIKNSINPVAVHFRLFDDKEGRFSPVDMQASYYRNAVKTISEKVTDTHYFLFSNKPDKAWEIFSTFNRPFTLVNHNKSENSAYLDLWLMSQCNHFIIANSTFSWWGAWLSDHRDKVVVSPGFEKKSGTGAWGFDGLLPDDWIKID